MGNNSNFKNWIKCALYFFFFELYITTNDYNLFSVKKIFMKKVCKTKSLQFILLLFFFQVIYAKLFLIFKILFSTEFSKLQNIFHPHIKHIFDLLYIFMRICFVPMAVDCFYEFFFTTAVNIVHEWWPERLSNHVIIQDCKNPVLNDFFVYVV